jgi:glycine cleavage system transcriptional repressor
MNQHVILTAIGADRPGLVDEVSQYLFERGANIEDSRMVNLRGQFAMMVLLAATPQALQAMGDGLPDFSKRTRLHAQLHAAQPQSHAAAAAAAAPYRLTATAMDRAGLVHHIAHLLRTLEVNIETLDTRLTAAPVTGAPLFEMELALSVPRQVSLATLNHRLAALCDDLNVDWQLKAL